MEFRYYCQKELEKLIDHMILVPNKYSIQDNFLYGCSKKEFVDGFKELQRVIIHIYMNMMADPESYGLVLTELQINEHSKNARDSKGSVYRLIKLLYSLGRSGIIQDHRLIIDAEKYHAIEKEMKISKAPILIRKLHDFGFEFEGLKKFSFDRKLKEYVLWYPSNPKVINVLKGYTMSALCSNSYVLHYSLVSDPNTIPRDQGVQDFVSCLDKDQQFFTAFHEQLMENQYILGEASCYRVRYFLRASDKSYTVECRSDGRRLYIGMKLKKMSEYSEYINQLPLPIKAMLSRSSCRTTCTFQGATPEYCKYRVAWRVDNMEYIKCSFEDVFTPKEYLLDDLKQYIGLLLKDREYILR